MCRCGRGKKKAVGHELAQWDWEAQREKIMRCIGGSTDMDLWKLFRPRNPDSNFLQKWLQVVCLCHSNTSAEHYSCCVCATNGLDGFFHLLAHGLGLDWKDHNDGGRM